MHTDFFHDARLHALAFLETESRRALDWRTISIAVRARLSSRAGWKCIGIDNALAVLKHLTHAALDRVADALAIDACRLSSALHSSAKVDGNRHALAVGGNEISAALHWNRDRLANKRLAPAIFEERTNPT